jgi:hypothetical protein
MADLQLKSEGAEISNPRTVIETKALARVQPVPSRPLERLELTNKLAIRLILCWCLVSLVSLSTVTLLILILLKGLGRPIPESLIIWFGGITVGAIVPLFGVFVRAVWQQNTQDSKS